jgi:hypothetical protein
MKKAKTEIQEYFSKLFNAIVFIDNMEYGNHPALEFYNKKEKLEELKKEDKYVSSTAVKEEIAMVINLIFEYEANEDFYHSYVNELIFKLNKFKEKEEKVNHLKKERKRLWKKFNDENKDYVLHYLNIKPFCQVRTWTQYIALKIHDLEDGNLLESYLKGFKISELPIDEIEQEITFLKEYSTTKQHILHIDKLLDNNLYLESNNELSIIDLFQSSSELNPKSKTKSKSLDCNQKVLLIEKILHDENFVNYSATKKGKILALLIDKNEDNIKKQYLQIEKKGEKNEKLKSDIILINNLY